MRLPTLGCCLALLTSTTLPAQLELDWARADGGPGTQWAQDVAAFPDGSCVATGRYYYNATFEVSGTHETSLPNTGSVANRYVSRYESDGSLRWAGALSVATRGGQLPGHERIAASPDGATYVGSTSLAVISTSPDTRRIIFHGENNSIPSPVPPPSGGPVGPYVVIGRYSSTGSVEWVRSISSSNIPPTSVTYHGAVYLHGTAALSDGSVVALGSFTNLRVDGHVDNVVVDFGNSVTLSSAPYGSSWHAFLVRFDKTGQAMWVRQIDGAGYPSPNIGGEIAAAADDSILISGLHRWDATNPYALRFGTFSLSPPSGADRPRYLARYDKNGAFQWATMAMDRHGYLAQDFDAFADGSTVLGGYMGSNLSTTFGPGSANPVTLSSGSPNYAWVARWDKSGQFQWVSKTQSTGSCLGYGVAARPDGSIALTGDLWGSITVGGHTASSVNARTNPYVALFDSTGGGKWVTTLRTNGRFSRPGGMGIDAAADGSLIATGNIWKAEQDYYGNYIDVNMTVSGVTGSETIYPFERTQDMYLAKWKGDPYGIADLPDIVRSCDGVTQTATINFDVAITGVPPAGSMLVVTDVTGTRTLLSTPATTGGHGVGPWAFPMGASTVLVTIQDSAGATLDSETFQVTVQDTVKPTLVGVGPKTLECQGGHTMLLRSMLGISATDNCDPNPHVSFTPGAVGLGENPVITTATDASGNTTSQTFTLTVVDTVPPAFIEFPANIERECEGAGGTSVSFTVTAEDLCDPDVDIICEVNGATVPATFGLGEHTVSCTAKDDSGNTTVRSFTVTIVDNTAPVLKCPGDITKCTDPDKCYAEVEFAVTVTDICDPSVPLTLVDQYDNEVMSGYAFPCGTTTVTATAKDQAGNEAQCQFNITVNDCQDPVITGPATLQLATDCAGAPLTFSPADLGITATDNCAVESLVSSPATVSLGTTIVTTTAIDKAGNSSTYMTSVTLLKGPFDMVALRPLDPGVDNKIKVGRVVPIKVRVSCHNAADATVTATIDSITRVDGTGTAIANEVVEDPGASMDNGNVMRPQNDGTFRFNLSTKNWYDGSGARFRVTIRVKKVGHVDTLYDIYLKNK